MFKLKTSKRQINNLALSALTASVLTACGGGGSCANCTTPGPNGGQLIFVAPSILPSLANKSGINYMGVYNPSDVTISGISYSMGQQVGSGNSITMDQTSAANCASIAAKSSCFLKFSVPESTIAGGTVVTASNSDGTEAATPLAIGVQQVPYTESANANGVGLYFYPKAQYTANGVPFILVTAVVQSPNVGTINTIELVDESGNVISGQVVTSNNSGPGTSPLQMGDVVEISLPIPQGVGITQNMKVRTSYQTLTTSALNSIADKLNLKNQSLKDGTNSSTGTTTYSLTTQSNNINLQFTPNQVYLTQQNSIQYGYLYNIGDLTASQIEVSSSSPNVRVTAADEILNGQRVIKVTYELLNTGVAPTSNLVTVTAQNPSGQTQTSTGGTSQNVNPLPVPTPSPTPTPTPGPSPTPSVSAVMSSSPTGNPAVDSVLVNTTFYIVLTLTGGQNVNTTYTVTAPAGFSPASSTCTLTSIIPVCNVAITAPGTVSTGSSITITGGIASVIPSSFSFNVGASPNQWVWMGGTNTIDSLGIYGVKGTPAISNLPGGRYLSSSWVDSAGNFWLFGGTGDDLNSQEGQLNDLWKYNPTTREWTWFTGSGVRRQVGIYGTQGIPDSANTPGSREGAMAWNRSQSGYLWLFGGSGCTSNDCSISGNRGHLNDLWKYNLATNEWTWMSGTDIRNSPGDYGTKGVEAPSNMPSSRYRGNTWIGASGSLWLFGGRNFSTAGEYLNDLWRYNPENNQWTWISGDNTGNQPGVYGTKGVPAAANVPGGRQNATSWTDASGNFWLFGGQGPVTGGSVVRLNDLWKYNPTTNEWTWMSGADQPDQPPNYGTKGQPNPTNVPGARIGAIGWADSSGTLWLFGGSGYDSQSNSGSLNDLWKYNPATNEWTWVSGDTLMRQPGIYGTMQVPNGTNMPGARNHSIGWIDSSNRLWLFGGDGYATDSTGGFLNDLWQYYP